MNGQIFNSDDLFLGTDRRMCILQRKKRKKKQRKIQSSGCRRISYNPYGQPKSPNIKKKMCVRHENSCSKLKQENFQYNFVFNQCTIYKNINMEFYRKGSKYRFCCTFLNKKSTRKELDTSIILGSAVKTQLNIKILKKNIRSSIYTHRDCLELIRTIEVYIIYKY